MSRATIRSISGPVLHATATSPFKLREAVTVGPQALLGEVVRLHDDEIVVQVYEDTTGLRPGAEVVGTGLPLAIRLGPGLLGNIFDGLLRPLSGADSVFVAPGMRRAAPGTFAFAPRIMVGEVLQAGAVYGEATAAAGRAQRCIGPPGVAGIVVSIAAPGDYAENATVCTLCADDGRTHALSMGHDWPVRTPRPVLRRLPAPTPLVTGQRIIDCLFPVALGGKAAVPGEGGYPAYLSSRLADFYERAAIVDTLGGDRGSVTVIGTISPPSGDFSEPVTSHTKRYVKAFWALDVKRAQARFYPAVHPLQSYAEDARDFVPWWAANGNGDWWKLRRRFLTLLDEQAHLERMARIIGKDALPVRQQLTLFCADLINDAFLRQSAFSVIDRVCSPRRQALMMRLIGRFVELAESAVTAGVHPDKLALLPSLRPLQRMGEEIADTDLPRFAALEASLDRDFAQLIHASEARDAAHG